MLSVVLYGRNDSHGYNLHKRAAISLNAIAELMDDPDDEILFVDYNTPDDLPTFPEAIADTLTQKAARRLRILRVRADVHRERFAARTHLAALEPIARNVAIRRSNPANKWILSTNTDMIFCPRAQADTLTAVVGKLADGFYHLPRFELPEGLWETLDRKDAPALIASAREWGERFHLNEIVYSGSDNLYDGPGDFQHFQREDLFAVGGFHEDMIRGWHLDANIARRMRILRGKVSSALDHLVGYHCDHTRQASPYHKADRVENDSVRFVDQIIAAPVPEQMDIWGLADVDIESLTLPQASGARYRRALDASIQGRLEGFLETSYVTEAHGRLSYDRDHVLPYLLDLVSCIRNDTPIAYIDARPDMFGAFAKGWAAMGGGGLLIPASAPWLDIGGSHGERVSDEAWVKRGELFIFGVGGALAANQADLDAEESARLWAVDRAFKRAAADDFARQARGAASRRAIVINGIHNFFEPQVMNSVSVTMTPFSSRVRHGYFVDRGAARAKAASEPARVVMEMLGAAEPPTATEVGAFQGLLDRLAEAGPDDGAWAEAGRSAAELEAYLTAGLVDGGDHEAAKALITQLRRPSALEKDSVHGDAGRGASSRMIRLEDWDDASWSALARTMFANRDHANLFSRDIWTWERVTLAQNLLAGHPPETHARVLVTGEHPERLAFVLAYLGFTVDIANPHALIEGRLAAVDWRDAFVREGWVSPTVVGLIDDRAAAIADGFLYDAVLIAQNGLFARGRGGAANLLHQAADLLKIGGQLGLAMLTQPLWADSQRHDHALAHALTRDGRFAQALAALTNLQPDGVVDSRLTARSLDRLVESPAQPESALPPLMFGALPEIVTPAAFALHKVDRLADWDALKSVLEAGTFIPSGAASALFSFVDLAALSPQAGEARYGFIFDALTGLPGVPRTPGSLQVTADFGTGVIGAAQLGTLAPGDYEMELEVEVKSVKQPGRFLSVAVINHAGVLIEQSIAASEPGSYRASMAFQTGADAPRAMSVLLKSWGAADFDVVNLVLR